MKNVLKIMVAVMTLALIAPTTTYAAKKKKKEVTWEMPSASGNAQLDTYFNTVNTAYTNFQTLQQSVTYYSVRPIQVTQTDGTVKTVRMVVDQNGTIRDSDKALQQYWDWGTAALDIMKQMRDIVKQKDNVISVAKKDFMTALAYSTYIINGAAVSANGLIALKDMAVALRNQGKEIRQFKKDYTEDGELKNATMDASTLDDSYTNNEPIQKTSEEFEKELAAAKAEGEGITAPDGDVDFGDLL
ncbi:MAG: hypothetical protein IJV34_03810 [Prevotella sp.]|nr:hypothetical protein [Prevotella sp.]